MIPPPQKTLMEMGCQEGGDDGMEFGIQRTSPSFWTLLSTRWVDGVGWPRLKSFRTQSTKHDLSLCIGMHKRRMYGLYAIPSFPIPSQV